MIKSHNLEIDNDHFELINSGAISHIVVCKEEGIEAGDYVLLQVPEVADEIVDIETAKVICKKVIVEEKSLMVKVAYKDIEGSGIEEDYCILSVRRV